MFYRGDYDCEVVLSSDDDCESVESLDKSEEENIKRSFVLGDNLLAFNGLEVIKVRKMTDEKKDRSEIMQEDFSQITNEIYDAIRSKNVSIKDRRAAYDETLSDLEDEEVSESEEDTKEYQDIINDTEDRNDVIKYKEDKLNTCTIDYELPTVGRYQSQTIIKPARTSMEELNQYCLQERQRRMKNQSVHANFVRNHVQLNDDQQINEVASINTSLSTIDSLIHVSNNVSQTILAKENLSDLSIDLLTEYINSDKPLKEIINKSKKQVIHNLKKSKKSKKRNSTKPIRSKKVDLEISIDCSLDVVEEENIKQESMERSFEMEVKQRSTLLNSFKDEGDEDRYMTSCTLESQDQLIPRQSPVIDVEERSQNSKSHFDKSIHLIESESNHDNFNSPTNFTDETDDLNISCSNHSKYLITTDSTVNDQLLSSLNLDSNEDIKSLSSLIIKDDTSCNFTNDYDSSRINQSLPLTNSDISLDNQSSEMSYDISNHDKSISSPSSQIIQDQSNQPYNSDLIGPMPLIIPDLKNEERSLSLSLSSQNLKDQSQLSNKSALKYVREPNLMNISDLQNVIDVRSNVEIEDQSMSSKSVAVRDIHQLSLPNNTLDNFDKEKSPNNFDLKKENEVINNKIKLPLSLKHKVIIEKYDKSSMPIEIKELIKTSFNKISQYNFLSNEDILQEPSTFDKSPPSSINVTDNFKIKQLKDVVNDKTSKENTTSSVDSGFHESNVGKENQCMKETIKGSTDNSNYSHNSDVMENDTKSYIKATNNNSCVRHQSQPQPFSVTRNNESKRSHVKKKDWFTEDNVHHRKINPFKKDYTSLHSSVLSTEEICEFLNFQWFKFCEMHTLYNLS